MDGFFNGKMTTDGKVLVFGHRGMSEYYPENTMLSFSKCACEPCIDGVELDVHLCKSGEVVVVHDSNLKRVSGLDVEVEDLTLEQISKIDVGSFKDPKFSDCRIPQLGDLFSAFGKRFVYDIELKVKGGMGNPELSRKVLCLVRDYGLEDNVMFSSFNPMAVGNINRYAKHTIPSADIFYRGDKYPKVLWNGAGHYISRTCIQKPCHDQVDQSYIDKYGKLPIITWTVNTKEEAQRLLALNSKGKKVYGLIGNDPIMLASVVGSENA